MAYKLLQRAFPGILRKVGSIEGLDNMPAHGPFILAANHISYVEPILLAILVVQRTQQRVYSLTKYPVWLFFRIFGLAGWLGMVPVRHAHNAHCLEAARDRLRGGSPVLIFPEGKRIYTHELGKGKTGAARLALWTGAPVVPVGFLGPSGRTTRASLHNYFRNSGSLTIRIGAPLRFSAPHTELTHDEIEKTTTVIMRAIAALTDRPYPVMP